VSKYWCENSAVFTHYHNGLSVLFPAWENLFCQVMEAHKHKITDPKLLADMDKFIKEEQAHSNAHHAHNKSIGELDMEEYQQHRADVLAKRPLSNTLLGAMVSIEHMASSMGRDFIDRYSDKTQKPYTLFLWHSKEEIGHKDVAYRVWSELAKDKKQLKKVAAVNFKTVSGFVVKYVWKRCKEEKLLSKASTWVDFVRLAYRMTTSLVIPYAFILKDSFDPRVIDDSKYGY
jgi:predicted metal-dependent hydrolase